MYATLVYYFSYAASKHTPVCQVNKFNCTTKTSCLVASVFTKYLQFVKLIHFIQLRFTFQFSVSFSVLFTGSCL